ncbi:MAG: tetratricopeptide repeat protein [Saprospiraceae bacterium]|nr:tetratricopeptide repeat protein [Saprospiraceae bacterium]
MRVLYIILVFISALGIVESAINLYQEEIDYENRCIYYMDRGEFTMAEEDLVKIKNKGTNDVLNYNNWGILYYKLGKFEKSIHYYNKSITLDDSYDIAYYNRGISKEELKDYKGAINDYNIAIELNNKYANAYNNRGYSLMQLGLYDEALLDFLKAYELDSFHRAIGNIISVYEVKNDCEKIIKYCEYYNEQFTPRKIAYYTMAKCKEKLGDTIGAKNDYKLMKQTIDQPNSEEVIAKLDNIENEKSFIIKTINYNYLIMGILSILLFLFCLLKLTKLKAKKNRLKHIY